MGTIEQGARNAVSNCMAVKPAENVLIVSDRNTAAIGKALAKESEAIAGPQRVRLILLEDTANRPLTSLPNEIKQHVPNWANVTFWAAMSLPGELVARQEFLDAVRSAGVRHGHMPNVTEQIMTQGMCADYDEVYKLTHKIYDIVKDCSSIDVTNRLGTNLSVQFDPSWKWVPSDGKYHVRGRWGNLPEGETFTAPRIVNGKLATNLLGDWFSEKYGNFAETLSFDVKDSLIHLQTISTTNRALKNDILAYLKTDIHSSRASEFALPTNPLLISFPTIGNLLQDEKARVHIAFGDPYQAETKAPWKCKTHVDMLLEQCDVVVDKTTRIMHEGKYVV